MGVLDTIRSFFVGGQGFGDIPISPGSPLDISNKRIPRQKLPVTALDRLLGPGWVNGTAGPVGADGQRLQMVSLTDAAALGSAMAGGRLTRREVHDTIGVMRAIMPPTHVEGYWDVMRVDAKALDTLPAGKLLQILAEVSPDVSKAAWDFLRFCNPGWEVKVYRAGNGKRAYRKGQKMVEGWIETMTDTHGAFDVVISRLFMGPFLRGGLFAEFVLDENGRDFVDIVTPDPCTVRFQRVLIEGKGEFWQFGQLQFGQFVPIDRKTVSYIPIDPMPGSPYGRAIAAPSVFITLFLLGLLHDMRRVISQQGYPRLDIAIAWERIKETMPDELSEDPKKIKQFLDSAISEVQNFYAHLQPDDAYVHLDSISVNRPVGAVDSSSLGGLGPIIERLERSAVRALKTMPLMFGITDGVSEANANRQWEIHTAGVKSVQHLCETMLERFFTLGLQANGIPAKVEFRFAELRSSEELRDQQTLQLKINNAKLAEELEYITHDEAAVMVTGHPAPTRQELIAADVEPDPNAIDPETGLPASEAEPTSTAPDAANVEPAQGETKSIKPITHAASGVPISQLGLMEDDDRLARELGFPWFTGRKLPTNGTGQARSERDLVGTGSDR